MDKIAVIIYESVEKDVSRVYRALKVASEFNQAGDDVVLLFDGSGVKSLAEMANVQSSMHTLLESLRSNIRGACAYCARAHEVEKILIGQGYAMISEAFGEISLRGLIQERRTILNF